ncbi:MAG TPA: tetratricopeptide repeat protein [Aquaticitalea sp.]|nr:tetratricopeptide repeat protein [Aquaticitalea sp.]
MKFSQSDDNYEYSLTKFESMLKTNNVQFFDSAEFEVIATHYLEMGKIALAKKGIKMGLEQHPASVEIKLLQVEIYVLEDKLQPAEKLLDTLYQIEPTNEEIYIQKASILSKRDEHQKAIDTLTIALNLVSEDEDVADIYALIGMEYLYMEQFGDAKDYFIKCLELDYEDYSSLYNIIYCFEYLELEQDAINFLTKYLDKNPYSEVAWHQMGRQYYKTKEYEKAVSAFDFAIISDDTFAGAYLEKGKALEKMKLYREAIENYKITLALNEPTSYAMLRIGNCYEKLKESDNAIQYYYKTVHEDPLLDKGWIAITKYYYRKKNYQKALYYINKAIGIDSENGHYWKLYAQINLRLNFLEEAENGYKNTLIYGNLSLDNWLNHADVLIQLGDFETACTSLKEAVGFHPNTADIEYRLAGIYFSLLETDKGHFHLKNGLKLNPELDYILTELFPMVSKMQFIKDLIAESKFKH